MDEKYGKSLGEKIEVAIRKTYVVLHGLEYACAVKVI